MSPSSSYSTPSLEPDRQVGLEVAGGHVAKRIQGVSASIISHRDFPARRWLYSGDTLWYYHAPKPPGPQTISNSDFPDTLDPCLKDLIGVLHRHGIYTTPSCQGHFYGKDHYLRVWDKLRREARKIRQGGLPLEDDETGRVFVFRSPRYRLAWKTFEEFHRAAEAHQNIGYIGLVVPDLEAAEALGRAAIASPYSVLRNEGEVEMGWLIDLFVRSPNEIRQCSEWGMVTEAIRQALATHTQRT